MAALLASRNMVTGLGPAPAAIGSTGLRPVRLASFAVCRVSIYVIAIFAGFLTRRAPCPWSIADRFALQTASYAAWQHAILGTNAASRA
jgi:hypothetical protein